MARRETIKERRARENKRRKTLEMAKEVVGAIRTRREASSEQERKLFDYFDKVMGSARLDAKWLESESVENIAQSFRLAADMLEEKPTDGRSLSGHDGKIIAACLEAAKRLWRDLHRVNPCYEDAILRITTAQPTFSEFLKVYRQQNPGVKVEASSLRRSLRRLGVSTLPEKRGRKPKEK
jgi:hypothetical protein